MPDWSAYSLIAAVTDATELLVRQMQTYRMTVKQLREAVFDTTLVYRANGGDDASALNAAIANRGGKSALWLPDPLYKFNAPLLIDTLSGFRVYGASLRGTVLQGQAALGSSPVIDIHDSNDIQLENMSVQGSGLGCPVLRSHRQSTTPAVAVTHLTLRDMRVIGGGSLADTGLLFDAEAGADSNNDQAFVENVEFTNCLIAVDEPMINTGVHTFTGVRLTGCTTGVRTGLSGGGTLNWQGGFAQTVTTIFLLRSGSNPSLSVDGLQAEQCLHLLDSQVNASYSMSVTLTNVNMNGSQSPIINWHGDTHSGSRFTATGCKFLSGSNPAALNFYGAGSKILLAGCELGVLSIYNEGTLVEILNTYSRGAISWSGAGSHLALA